MSVSITKHGDRASESYGKTVDAIGGQTADAVEVADGEVSAALGTDSFYRIAAITDSRVRIGAAPADATGGEYWPAGQVEIRRLGATMKVACDAIA